MKGLVYIILIPVFIISCNYDKQSKEVILVKKSDLIEKNIVVKGMTCVGCEITVEDKLKKIKGVVKVKASHNEDNLIIQYDSTKTNVKKIKEKIKTIGYKTF